MPYTLTADELLHNITDVDQGDTVSIIGTVMSIAVPLPKIKMEATTLFQSPIITVTSLSHSCLR